MTLSFWLYLIPAVLTFAVIAWLTDLTCRQIQAAYRRWACRREMARSLAESKAQELARLGRSSYADVISDGRGTLTFSAKPRPIYPLDVDALADLLLRDESETIH